MHTFLYAEESTCMCRDTLCSGGRRNSGGEELLNKVIIFVFFAHKKYSRRFVKLWLSH